MRAELTLCISLTYKNHCSLETNFIVAGGDKHVVRALPRRLLAACLHFYDFLLLFYLKSKKHFAFQGQRTEYLILNTVFFFFFPKIRKMVVQTGTSFDQEPSTEARPFSFSGSNIHRMRCVHIFLSNEQKHKRSWQQTTVSLCRDGAMASLVRADVGGWGSRRCKEILLTAVFSKGPQILWGKRTFWPCLHHPDAFGTQASLPMSF